MSPSAVLRGAAAALLAAILLGHGFIDLELARQIGGWQANAPVADLAALLLVAVAGMAVVRGGTRGFRPPGLAGWLLFLVACAASIPHAVDPAGALHHLVRKPVFFYVAYGCATAFVVARLVPPRFTLRAAAAGVAVIGAVSLASSADRIAAGGSLWFAPLAGLTPNHKTLAVVLAAWLPLLLAEARADEPTLLPRWAAWAVAALAGTAIVASASKTAWIAAAFGAGLYLPASRPISLRPRLAIPGLVLGFVLATAAPLALHSMAMLDAARSRQSLNHRAWTMFAAHPLVGSGTGMNVEIEAITFPDYRVNGVDAHGVVQKVASETGLLGLAGFGWFTATTGLALVRRWDGQPRGLDYGVLGSWAALQLTLLLSTETLSPTTWAPLAVFWGLSERPRA